MLLNPRTASFTFVPERSVGRNLYAWHDATRTHRTLTIAIGMMGMDSHLFLVRPLATTGKRS